MVDKLKRTESISSANISRYKKSTKTESAGEPKISRTLINEIINELRAEKAVLSPETVQHKVIVKTLMANFGFAASTEPKFKKIYERINQLMIGNEQAQALINQAIARYGDTSVSG